VRAEPEAESMGHCQWTEAYFHKGESLLGSLSGG